MKEVVIICQVPECLDERELLLDPSTTNFFSQDKLEYFIRYVHEIYRQHLHAKHPTVIEGIYYIWIKGDEDGTS